MSKELQAFKDLLKQLFPNYDVDVSFDDICNLNVNLNIIKNAIKRLEEHDKIFKKYNIDDNWLEPALYVIKNHFPMDTEAQLKKLKALDVIKEKRVNACEIINSKDVREYNWSIHTPKKYPLTQEEFDILKEVL